MGCGSGWVVVVGLEFERVSVEKRVSPLTLRSASGSVEMTASGVGCGLGWVVVVGSGCERGSVEKRVSPRLGGFGARWGSGWACGWCGGSSRSLLRGGRGCRSGCRRRRCGGIGSVLVGWRRSFCPSPRGTYFGQSLGTTGVSSGPACRCSIHLVRGSLCSLVCRLNAETRLLAGPSLFFSTVSILLNWTKLNCHFGWVYLFGLSDFICFSCGDLGWILGLDKLFC